MSSEVGCGEWEELWESVTRMGWDAVVFGDVDDVE